MILITGATGNIGKEVLKQVAQTGMPVRAAVQSPGKTAIPEGVDVAIVDYNQPETLRSALNGVDRVFLVGPPTAQLVALERKAVDVIASSGVRHLVKLSAMGGRAATFPRQHAESEDYILSQGVPFTFLRPNGFMQNFVNYASSSIVRENVFYGSEGDGRISHIDIRDIAAVATRVLTEDGHIGHIYTLTGPEPLSNAQAAEMLSDVLGRPIRFVNLDPAQLRQALLSAGTPEWSAEALLDLQRLYREGGAAQVTLDVEQVLRRKPIRFAEFIRDYREAFEPRAQAAV